MPEQLADTPAEQGYLEDAIARMAQWSDVMMEDPGKQRFVRVRTKLQEKLRDMGAPSSAKKFLTERMIKKVGRTGDTDDLPDMLKGILGNEEAQADFVADLQIAHQILDPRISKDAAKQAFDGLLTELEAAGMPPEKVEEVRKLGPSKLMKLSEGVGTSLAGSVLSQVSQDPEAQVGLASLASVAFGAGMGPRKGKVRVQGRKKVRIASPPAAAATAAKAAPAAATTAATAAKTAGRAMRVLRMGGSWLNKLAGNKYMAAIGLIAGALQVRGAMKQSQGLEEAARMMEATGGYGTPAELSVPIGTEGEAITASQFLKAMSEKEKMRKARRFQAVMQENQLTEQVLSAITQPAPQSPQATGKFKLGSARMPQAPQMSPELAMEHLDEILRQADIGF